jgi:hypothetical protein
MIHSGFYRSKPRRFGLSAWPHMLVALSAFWAYAACAQSTQQAQIDLPRVQLSAGMHLISAQVAATPHQRETGLMHRAEMPSGEGMIFIFESASSLCFWMKNTLIPLTAAFIAEDGTIINLEDMKPMTTDSHCAKKPARFVLEMNQGWFAKRGIKEGQKINGPLFRGR